MPSKTVKAKSKSVEPINKCEFLKGEYKLSTLKSACVALNIKVEDGDTADILCKRMQKERPDLMRGKMWSLFRVMLYDLDLKKSYKALILALLSSIAA